MLLSLIIKTLLSNQDIPYRLVDSANPANLAQTHASISFLKDASGTVMAIYNNEHQFDLLTLKALIDRPKLRFMSTQELDEVLFSFEDATTRPFNKMPLKQNQDNGIQLIIDEPISTQSTVLLVTDDPDERIQVDIWDMQLMIENALIGGIFSHENRPKHPLTGNVDIAPLNIVTSKKSTFG